MGSRWDKKPGSGKVPEDIQKMLERANRAEADRPERAAPTEQEQEQEKVRWEWLKYKEEFAEKEPEVIEKAKDAHDKDLKERKKEMDGRRKETIEKKKDRDYGKHEPSKAAQIVRALRSKNLDNGFYGHTRPEHFQKTRIISTYGR